MTVADDDQSRRNDLLRDDFSVRDFVEAAAVAAHRSRTIILIVVVTSIIALTGFWNSRQGSWITGRLVLVNAALRLRAWDVNTQPPIEQTDLQLYERAQAYVKVRGIKSEHELRLLQRSLYRVYVEHVSYLHIPIVGVALDVNDTGMLAGLVFSVLLIVLRLSLSRELENTVLVFRMAEARSCLATCHRLLKMRQVFTIPPFHYVRMPALIRHLPKALFCLPVVVQFATVLHDLYTMELGRSVSATNTSLVIAIGGGWLSAMAVLTWSCVSLQMRLDTVWQVPLEKLKATISALCPDASDLESAITDCQRNA